MSCNPKRFRLTFKQASFNMKLAFWLIPVAFCLAVALVYLSRNNFMITVSLIIGLYLTAVGFIAASLISEANSRSERKIRKNLLSQIRQARQSQRAMDIKLNDIHSALKGFDDES